MRSVLNEGLVPVAGGPSFLRPDDLSFALIWAVSLDRAAMARLLLEAGADPFYEDPRYEGGALRAGVAFKTTTCLSLVLEAQDERLERLERLKRLSDGAAEHAADLSKARATAQRTYALRLAAHEGNAEAVSLLLAAGAEPTDVKDDDGKALAAQAATCVAVQRHLRLVSLTRSATVSPSSGPRRAACLQ